MSDDYRLWCFVQRDNRPFSIIASSTTSIHELKDLIMETKKNFLKGLDVAGLDLWKVCYLF